MASTPCSLGQRDDAVDVEVRADRLARLADAVGLVRLEAVQGEAVFVRVDGDGADAQLVGRAEDADGDLAAIGDQQLRNFWHDAQRRREWKMLEPSRDSPDREVHTNGSRSILLRCSGGWEPPLQRR